MTLTQLTEQHTALLALERETTGERAATIREERDRIADEISERYQNMF